MRVAQAVTQAATELAAAGVSSARVDAELLAAFVLGIPRGRLAVAADFATGQWQRYRDLIRERSSRVPLQYLTGTASFRRLELAVGPGVFVPRPETEALVEWGLRWLSARAAVSAAEPLVVDLCAGSGAIAVSVVTEAAGARVFAVEWDAAALKWLRRNASGRAITVVEGDATGAETLSELDGQVDLVLCNPPYVPEIGSAGLPAEVAEHDPHAAVFGGTDGLDVIRPLIGRVATLLRPGGRFGVEHDDTHAYVVPTLVAGDARFADVELHHDLARRPRFTTATRNDGVRRMADFTP